MGHKVNVRGFKLVVKYIIFILCVWLIDDSKQIPLYDWGEWGPV